MTINDFINLYYAEDPLNLRLKLNKENFSFNLDYAITQIECRKKTSTKLRNFTKFIDFRFPDNLSAEQASHQSVAIFHSNIINPVHNILDMTAGLGIDTFILSKIADRVYSCDTDSNKIEALHYNSKVLGVDNVIPINMDSIQFLKNSDKYFDVIFVDPSRRNIDNKRTYNLRDCQPNIIGNQNLLFEKTKHIIIKASPLLDITQTLKDFSNISSVKAVGVKGECKEILIVLEKKQTDYDSDNIFLEAIDLDNDGNITSGFNFHFNLSITSNSNIIYAQTDDLQPGYFLLEPSAMIMKISPWEKICEIFKAKKFDKSSNLFVSAIPPKDFPGRVSSIDCILSNKDRKSLKGIPASVISRNYPVKAEIIRKSLQLKEGDNTFIYASKINNKPIMIKTNSIL